MNSVRKIMIGLVFGALLLAAAPEAAAGGECNPGTIDRECKYKAWNGSEWKEYYCTLWTGSYCVADLGTHAVEFVAAN